MSWDTTWSKWSKAERRWFEAQAEQLNRPSDDKPARSLSGRMQRACDSWSVEAGHIAVGLTRASVTLPPSPRSGGGRRSGPADPTGAALMRTLDTLDRDIQYFAHLTGRCRLDGQPDVNGMLHRCLDLTAHDLAVSMGIDRNPAGVVDGLLGTPPTSARTFELAVQRAYSWHALTAATVLDRWRTAYRQGAEPSQLGAWCDGAEQQARRMTGLAGRLAGWSDRTERRCRTCDGAAPLYGQGATCVRCRKRQSRARTA